MSDSDASHLRGILEEKEALISELNKKIENYEYIIQYTYDTCLCERFTTEGFDYHEKHPKRDENNGGKRPFTPKANIENIVGFTWRYDDTQKPYKSWKELNFNGEKRNENKSNGQQV